MAPLFENLGRRAGRALIKGKCLYESLAGDDEKAIEAEGLLGAELAGAIQRELGLAPAPEAQHTTSDIGTALTAKLVDKRRDFIFRVVANGDPNAFALPGGFVYMTQTLLGLCDSDPDEMAFVLGHEVGHVVLRHSIDRILTGTVLTAVGNAVSPRSIVASWATRQGLTLLTRAYSRDQETQADGFAVRLARAAGYDPAAATRLLARLQQASRTPKTGTISSYFSTHPPLEDRIASLRSRIAGN